MRDVAIRAEGLGKRYWIGGAPRADSLRDSLKGVVSAPIRRAVGLARGHGSAAAGHEALWALRDASFEVTRGESLGIIGANGAGKSTLLKVLTRITAPTEGSAELRGRVASLLEVGTGFHPDLTGEENIYLNGAILGMTRREVKRSFGEIVAFAGVEKFINTAVKHYSSGMYTRLAFAVAAHLEAEILIVDEVLAVGDLEFQRRCIDRMDGVAQSGRTVIFVSHNMSLIASFCQNALLLDGGRIVSRGTPEETAAVYSQRSSARSDISLSERTDRKGNGEVRLESLRVFRGEPDESMPAKNTSDRHLYASRPAVFEIEYAAADCQSLPELHMSFTILTTEGVPLFTCGTRFQRGHYLNAPSRGVTRCVIPRLPLTQGRYAVNVWCAVSGRAADYVQNAANIDVISVGIGGTGQVPTAGKQGPILISYDWHEVKIPQVIPHSLSMGEVGK